MCGKIPGAQIFSASYGKAVVFAPSRRLKANQFGDEFDEFRHKPG
jgi:hypothetical protein